MRLCLLIKLPQRSLVIIELSDLGDKVVILGNNSRQYLAINLQICFLKFKIFKIESNLRIFASKFQNNRSQVLSSSLHDLATYTRRTDEQNLADALGLNQSSTSVTVARQELHQIRIVTASNQDGLDELLVVRTRPGCKFGELHDGSITSKHRRNDGRGAVVERIVLRTNGQFSINMRGVDVNKLTQGTMQPITPIGQYWTEADLNPNIRGTLRQSAER